MPWLTLIQIGLLVAWFTVVPTLPWWVVFIPTMVGVAVLFAVLVVFVVTLAATK